jgi:fatty-acyl-CoA synthase
VPAAALLEEGGNRHCDLEVEPLVQTLPSRISAAAELGGTVTFLQGDTATAVLWAQIHQDARRMAAGLQANGIRPGDHVAILGPTSRDLVTAIQATWLAGATVVVLPLPMRMSSIDEFVTQTRDRVLQADTTLLLVDPDLAPYIERREGDPPSLCFGDVHRSDRFVAPEIDPSSLAIIQFTSGSTSDPKGVMLPHATITANLDGIIEATTFTRHDVLVSWLPLYHDMGLVGMLLLPMTTGCDLALASPQDFMAAPSRWMEWLSTYGATATAGPNFAWVLATRALKRMDALDLSPLRVALNGAEPVDPATVEAFIEAGARHGLRPGAVFPAFGMAEVSIAGTFPEPMSGLRFDVVDQRVLETEGYAASCADDGPNARRLVKLGRPIAGLQIRIVDSQTGQRRREREVGELEIRGTSLTTGYYNRPDATAEAFRQGWLRTGDLAYLVGGELVMCGRIKDLIIVGGRNVYPQDIEAAVATVEGVRAGNVIAFGVEGRHGREAVVVVAESKAGDPEPVRKLVAQTVREAIGVPPREVVLVAPGSLPKTSSGKLQRSLCRARYLDEALQPV